MKWFQPTRGNDSPVCQGTDPSHNYDHDWQKYGSTDACSEFYEGPKPFSEPETRSISNFLNENKNEINVCCCCCFFSFNKFTYFLYFQ